MCHQLTRLWSLRRQRVCRSDVNRILLRMSSRTLKEICPVNKLTDSMSWTSRAFATSPTKNGDLVDLSANCPLDNSRFCASSTATASSLRRRWTLGLDADSFRFQLGHLRPEEQHLRARLLHGDLCGNWFGCCHLLFQPFEPEPWQFASVNAG